ncbi:hypothetical protein HPB50_016318 [Hyalomma asiaticum]|uniref:Uncharacterized protein n=1 Tax=Hyalomma asiaticum TaxID=266040 RepID=A0ACB7RQ89_HYAAI|nr:hypothetical protein HPB50_016318 [Hyalomma asiaticum]
MAGATYTLTGFGEFLERRRVAFVEPLPAVRVCAICGLVPPSTQLLPCCHVVCADPCGTVVADAGACPLDGQLASRIVTFKLERRELDELLVHCLNGADNCDFTGKLGELGKHFSTCARGRVDCLRCGTRVRRDTVAAHCRTSCRSATSTSGKASAPSGDEVEELGSGNKVLERLRLRLSKQMRINDAIVDSVDSLEERTVRLETQLLSAAKGSEAELKGTPPANAAPGPYRCASGPGAGIKLLKFVCNMNQYLCTRSSPVCSLQGYGFRLSIEKSNSPAVSEVLHDTLRGDLGRQLALAFREACHTDNTESNGRKKGR